MREGGVIIEFIPRGRFVKVSAMDVKTLTEVCIVGDAQQSEDELKRTAKQKLRYVLDRDRKPRGSGKGGIVV
ncbi:hypothetical protein SAMN05216241_102344 [Limimonas halophila]|uniref:DUF6898 domain-containing protein n=1 Tax=Limimonas halophila TaxID=1082479 RepID=A0A1G7NZ70_9PROT|nr:hypothetical protein SAMN05216241_102344 [Limimonas halophila]